MAIKPFSIQLSALLLSILTTLTPILSHAIECESRLTGGAPNYSESQEYFGSRRFVKAEERVAAMAAIGAPSTEEIDKILKVSRLQEKYNGRLGIMARATIDYLVSRADWTPFQKAVFWDSMAVEIDKRVRALGLAPFSNFYHDGSDGSFMFQGEIGETLVFTTDGRIFKGNIESIAMKANWRADYSLLRELK